MEISLETIEVKAKINDVEVVFKEPSVDDYEKFVKDITEGKKGEIAAMIDLISKMGVDKKLVKKMTLTQMKKLVKVFTEGK